MHSPDDNCLYLRCMVQEEGWVVCRVFKKRLATVQRMADSSPCWFDDHVAGFMPALGSPRQLMHHHHPSAEYGGHHQQLYHCKPELEYHHHLLPSQEAFLPQLSQLVESPKPPAYIGHGSSSNLQSSDEHFRYTGQQQMMKTAAYMAAVIPCRLGTPIYKTQVKISCSAYIHTLSRVSQLRWAPMLLRVLGLQTSSPG
jgi:hypothetical protein